jgi:hypothetical protein
MKHITNIIITMFSAFALFEAGVSDSGYYRVETNIGYQMYYHGITNSIYGGWRTWMEKDGFSGAPFRDIYTIGNKTQFGDYYLDIKHFCNHRVDGNAGYRMPDDYWGGKITTFSVGMIIR